MRRKVCATEQAIQRPISCSRELKIKATRAIKKKTVKSYYLYYPTVPWHAVSKHSKPTADLISYQRFWLPTGSRNHAPSWTPSNCVKPGLLRWIHLPAAAQQKAQSLSTAFLFQTELQQILEPVLSCATGHWHLQTKSSQDVNLIALLPILMFHISEYKCKKKKIMSFYLNSTVQPTSKTILL